ncbi:MAG: gamma-glutamyl-gamma-aminobutyrate hydrolase family protein [Bacteroidota bacterium]
MIKIGISACFLYPDKNRVVFGPKSLTYIENDMARYLTQKGVLPILIPDVETELLQDILAQMDGFVFQGGNDLASETYGEKPIGKWKGDRYRDQYELRIMDYAIQNGKPVLGICRGLQLMNVYFGGSLYQDTVTQNPDAMAHRSAELYDTIRHPITFKKDSFLDRLYVDEKAPHVNTVHHQTIKELGENLEVYATAPDGIIEAIGYTKEPEGKVMAVQWHPEFFHTLKDELIDANKVYDAFLGHVKCKE